MKKFIYILLFVIASIARQSVAQQTKIDSLLTLIETDTEDTNKVKHLHIAANEYINIGEYDSALQYAKQELTLAQNINFKKGIANAFNSIGLIYSNQGNYPQALKQHFTSLKIREEIKDKNGIASSYNNIGNIYKNQGNYPEALKNHFEALKIREEIKDKQGIAASFNNIGNIFSNQDKDPEGLKMHFEALKIREEIKDKQGIAASYNNIGNIYSNQGNYPEALKMHLASLKIKEESGDKDGIATSYTNIGNIYMYEGNLPEALKMHYASLKIYEEIEDKEGMATSSINIGNLYIKLNKPKEAEDYLNKALQLSKELGSNDDFQETYAGLATLDSTMGNYKAAFEHHKLYILYRDSLNNEETQKKSLQTGMQYEFDKKEIAAKADQDKLDAVNAEEKNKQRIVIYAVAGLLVLVAVFAVFMFNRFRITQKQKAVIEEQKVLVDKAYETLHEKNKEVMDSIHYAKRIQTALITSEKYITNSINRLMKN